MTIGGDTLPAALAVCEDAVASGKALGAYLYVSRHGKVVADAAVGEVEPGVPAAPGDVGELRCAVKPLTTICVARAIEAGSLNLDDTLARWAPADTSARIAGLSIRSLLSHTAGMPNYLGPDVYAAGFDDYVADLLTAEIMPGFWDAQPIYNFARAWHLLAWVLQRIHGQPIHDIVTESVTRPLGLSSMSLLDPSGASRPYQRRTADRGFVPIRDTDADTFATRPNPAYGGFSTTRDLGRLYEHLMRCRVDAGLLRPETMRLLLQDHGGVRFRPGESLLPFGLGFFLGGAAARFGTEWDANGFGHMGSIRKHFAAAALCAPSDETVVALRFSSIGLSNNALFAGLGRAVTSDLGRSEP